MGEPAPWPARCLALGATNYIRYIGTCPAVSITWCTQPEGEAEMTHITTSAGVDSLPAVPGVPPAMLRTFAPVRAAARASQQPQAVRAKWIHSGLVVRAGGVPGRSFYVLQPRLSIDAIHLSLPRTATVSPTSSRAPPWRALFRSVAAVCRAREPKGARHRRRLEQECVPPVGMTPARPPGWAGSQKLTLRLPAAAVVERSTENVFMTEMLRGMGLTMQYFWQKKVCRPPAVLRQFAGAPPEPVGYGLSRRRPPPSRARSL